MNSPAQRQGQVGYRLKTPYRDGTTPIVLEPLDFMARLPGWLPGRPTGGFRAAATGSVPA